MTSSWFNAAFHCFIVILITHIKHLFTLFLNFYIQSTLNCMTSCHGATPTVNSRCTNPTRVHRSWLRVHEFTTSMERCFTGRELVITRSRLQWNAALDLSAIMALGFMPNYSQSVLPHVDSLYRQATCGYLYIRYIWLSVNFSSAAADDAGATASDWWWYSPCNSPCVVSPVGNSPHGGPGPSGLVHEEAHPSISYHT